MYLLAFEIVFEIVLTILFCLTSYPFRAFAILYAKYFKPDLIQIIGGTDSRLAVVGPHKSIHKLMAIFVIEGSLSAKEFQQIVERVLTAKNAKEVSIYERLKWTWKIFMGYPFWRRTEFKVEDHIRDYDYNGKLSLPKVCTKPDLEVVLGGLANEGWNPERSPWEILIAKNYHMDESSNCSEVNTALISCFDHVLMDGVSLNNFMKKCLNGQTTMPKMKLGLPRGGIMERSLVWMKLPYDYLKLVESTRSQRQLAENPECPQGYSASVSANIPVKLIKAIKTHYGVSYAAVLNAVVIGAIQEILLRNNIPVPKFLNCEYVVPSPQEHPGTMTNHFHSFPVRWQMLLNSAEERLYACQKNITAISNSAAPIALYWYQQLQSVLPAKFHGFMMSREDRGIQMTFSNFPVLDVHLNTNEHRLCEMFVGHNPIRGCGICILVAGINGNQRFVTFVDKSFISDSDFATNFQSSIQGELTKLMENLEEYPAPSC